MAQPSQREKATSWVLAGGLLGAIAGPNLAARSRSLTEVPFAGAYWVLAVVAMIAMVLMAGITFPKEKSSKNTVYTGRSALQMLRQPVFVVACLGAALGYGVMNLLMAATPLAMQQCGLSFDDTALVLEWHVIGMFAPGFFTGALIKRFGTLSVMGAGVVLNALCIAIALTGIDLHQFVVALFLLGVGWNFLFTASTTLSFSAYAPEEKDRAQAVINFGVFAVMALTSFASGALVTNHGWTLLNLGSIIPVAMTGTLLLWLAYQRRALRAK